MRLSASRQTPKLEDHPWSAVHDYLFNIFAAILHIWRPTPPAATRDAASCRVDMNTKMVPMGLPVKILKYILPAFILATWPAQLLCGRETRYLTLREERWLRCFKTGSLSEYWAEKRRELVLEKAKKEGHHFFSFPNIVRAITSRYLARKIEGRSVFKISTYKHTGKKSLGRPKRRRNEQY